MTSGRNLNLNVKYVDPAKLTPRAHHPRTHSANQVDQIAWSIRTFGFLAPVLISAKGEIILGHGRVMAAVKEDIKKIPAIEVEHLSPEEIRALAIADNKICANAGWDKELLAVELKELEVHFNFDLKLMGFETPEVDILLEGLDAEQPEDCDVIMAVDRSKPPVSRVGDLWQIGHHSLLCGNALQPRSYELLLGSEKAQMVFTDPPWNTPVSAISGNGRFHHPEFAMASGEMQACQFTTFLKTAFEKMVAFSADGSIHFVCMGWSRMREILDASTPYSELKNLCIWNKTNSGMGALYRSKHELFFVFKSGRSSHINNIELGRHGRNRTNVWDYAGANAFGGEREKNLAMHPTSKPVSLISDAMLDCSNRGGIILDPFAGSGSTLIAAEKTGRRGFGIEIDAYYVDTILRRFSEVYGIKAVHAQTGLTFVGACGHKAACVTA